MTLEAGFATTKGSDYTDHSFVRQEDTKSSKNAPYFEGISKNANSDAGSERLNSEDYPNQLETEVILKPLDKGSF
jgi:hypothetical protein